MSITARIDRVTAIPPDMRQARPPAPRAVKVELTGHCNYRCGFCALRLREHQPVHDMTWPLFQKIAAELRAAGVEELGLFYLGESFTNRALLVNAIVEAKRLGFPYVFLTTNGSLATPAAVEACMAAGLDSLKFSINATPDQFADVMGVPEKWLWQALEHLAAARGIRDAGRYGCRIYASSIQFDGAQQDAMEAFLAAHVRPFVDEHYWLPLYSMGAFAAEREAELGYKPIAGNQGRIGALRQPLPCWSAFTEAHVTHDGKLSACCFDATGSWTMGDLSTQTFADAWHSEAFATLRAAHLAGNVTGTVCERCLAYA
jgi:hypothetical protein